MSGQAAAWEAARLHEQLGGGCSALHPEPWLLGSSRRLLKQGWCQRVPWSKLPAVSLVSPTTEHWLQRKLRAEVARVAVNKR